MTDLFSLLSPPPSLLILWVAALSAAQVSHLSPQLQPQKQWHSWGAGAPTAIQMLTALADSTERSHKPVTPLVVWCLVGRAASGGCFACSFSWIFLQTYPSSTRHPPASCRTGRTCSYHLYPQCGWRKQIERTKDASVPWCDLLLPLTPSLVRREAQSLGGALTSSPFILFRFPCQSLLMVLIDFAVFALEPECSQVRVLWTSC